MEASRQITALIADTQAGDPGAWDRLLPHVYDELRRIAHAQLRQQRPGHTLNTTALVHEAWFKLADHDQLSSLQRAHFFGIASRAMRQVLIDYARRYASAKRGGGWKRVPLDQAEISIQERADMLVALDDALCRLSLLNERLARVVECRFFGGMTETETATALGITDRTVRRDWTKARLWLYGEMEGAQ
jgi:RNA polymerase sigma factor (TIGR02999 family)